MAGVAACGLGNEMFCAVFAAHVERPFVAALLMDFEAAYFAALRVAALVDGDVFFCGAVLKDKRCAVRPVAGLLEGCPCFGIDENVIEDGVVFLREPDCTGRGVRHVDAAGHVNPFAIVGGNGDGIFRL